jgi:CBS-domain-containing membrane protein
VRVEDVMSRGAVTCRVEDNAAKAAGLMWERDFGFLPVLDREGRAVAAITDRDLCMAAYTQGRALAEIPVASAMSRTLVSVKASDELATAERLMQIHQVRRLPVLDENRRLIGVCALSDLARAAARAADFADDEVAHTLCEVARPQGYAPGIAV